MQNSKVLLAQILPNHSTTYSNYCLLLEGRLKKTMKPCVLDFEFYASGFWILCNWLLNFMHLTFVACAIDSCITRISQAQSQKIVLKRCSRFFLLSFVILYFNFVFRITNELVHSKNEIAIWILTKTANSVEILNVD